MKKKKRKGKGQSQDLWKNPSYRNLVNPHESKYPQPKKTINRQDAKYAKKNIRW